jgi:peroxisomal enoyl-CoA hydratase 2
VTGLGAEEPARVDVSPGVAGLPFVWIVEAGKVHEFAGACLDSGASDPAYVPLTITEVATHFWEPPESRAGFNELDRSRLLHGEQEFEYERPLMLGDVLTGQTQLKARYTKAGRRGGEMTFTVYETTFVDATGGVVVRATKTLLEVSDAPHA